MRNFFLLNLQKFSVQRSDILFLLYCLGNINSVDSIGTLYYETILPNLTCNIFLRHNPLCLCNLWMCFNINVCVLDSLSTIKMKENLV